VLWLFDDSLVTSHRGRDRRTSMMVRNSVATQASRDPSASDARFFWRGGKRPASYFPAHGDGWLWPSSGLVHHGHLTVLLMRVRANRGGLGFAVVGWSAWRADALRGEPDRWRWRELALPLERFDAIVGSGGLVALGDHVVAIAARQSNPHAVMLARWRVDDFDRGRLDAMEWWGGAASGWIAQARVPVAPVAILEDEPLEFTIHYDTGCGEWRQLGTSGFGAADIEWRSAPSLTGPWSAPERLFHPPEADRTDTLVYQAKAHPWLLGEGLVLTYLANARSIDGLVDMRLYTPRFLRIERGCSAR
jgi:hypothetical protein